MAYWDENWANCLNTHRSTTDFCIFIGNSLVFWKFKKQNTILRSSVELDYRAMATVICKLTWLKYLLRDLQITIFIPTTLYCDNLVASHIDVNLVFHECTKHIELDCHLVQDRISNGHVVTTHTFSSNQLADLLTKPLHSPTFNKLLWWKSSISMLHLVGEC